MTTESPPNKHQHKGFSLVRKHPPSGGALCPKKSPCARGGGLARASPQPFPRLRTPYRSSFRDGISHEFHNKRSACSSSQDNSFFCQRRLDLLPTFWKVSSPKYIPLHSKIHSWSKYAPNMCCISSAVQRPHPAGGRVAAADRRQEAACRPIQSAEVLVREIVV